MAISFSHVQEELIAFPNQNGLEMVGTLTVPAGPPPFPAVLVVHGFRGNREERHIRAVAQSIAAAGILAFRFDLTNNLGASGGDFADLTLTGELNDTAAAHRLLLQDPRVRPHAIGITGHSLGGLVAALYTAREPAIRALVTLSAVFDFRERFTGGLNQEQLRLWRKEGFIPFDERVPDLRLKYSLYEDLLTFDFPAEVSKINVPLLVVQGVGGRDVGDGEGERFLKAARSAIKDRFYLQGADHIYTDNTHLQQLAQATAQWFQRHLT